ncbi:MAG: DUF6090 family protein [Saprospiraceae bacterium]
MIKFFRKVRQNLLAEHKVSKYLAYAVGEIILVVIGILIALKVNNWSTQQKNSALEKEICAYLNMEYKSAKKNLGRLDSLLAKQKNVLIQLSENCSPDPPSISKELMDSLITYSFAAPTFSPPNATLNDILNTGKIEVIRNVELRNLLSTWNGKLEESNRQELNLSNFLFNRYVPFLEGRIEFQHKEYVEVKRTKEPKSFGMDSRSLLNDLEYCNLVRRAIYFNSWVSFIYLELEIDIDRIIEITQE